MILDVRPTPYLRGAVRSPSSKSYSIRSVIVAACGGRSILQNVSSCDDVRRALDAAKALGARVIISADGRTITIQADFNFTKDLLKCSVGESGTVLRFLLPLLALRPGPSMVLGQGTLRSRPNKFLTETLRRMGRDVRGKGLKETIPIRINKGFLRSGNISIDGSLSSQFISALLIACPFLQKDTTLKVTGKTAVSKTYVDMTLAILKKAGIKIDKASSARFVIKGEQKYSGLGQFTVPSDYGLAAFLLAAGILSRSQLTLQGFFCDELVQADGQIMAFLKRMGARIIKTKTSLKVKGPHLLSGGVFSLRDCPDLVPIMAVLALFAKGRTKLCHIAHARAKESDRISDLRSELLKIGACIREEKDSLTIYPQAFYRQDVILDPRQDHRLAMAFSVLGLKIGTQVKDIECVRKSYPDFISDLQEIGAKLKKR
ncbi:MAG TPA: 3-phosphoshikimate 1-carboxyvinyltransferase [Candidatus Omnitrophota bacterium]|nr:3-phosphoshikimate 1-carboxyvinyltransferase [Candidatus Omnitrophota bacterium]HQL40736.1 3-phosphoshikimate 1-carboxyvinyltransferase [Candidatus Omnitrophota bacterium]